MGSVFFGVLRLASTLWFVEACLVRRGFIVLAKRKCGHCRGMELGKPTQEKAEASLSTPEPNE